MGYGRKREPGWRGSSHSSTSARTSFERPHVASFRGTFDYTLDRDSLQLSITDAVGHGVPAAGVSSTGKVDLVDSLGLNGGYDSVTTLFVMLEFVLGGVTERWQLFLGLVLLGDPPDRYPGDASFLVPGLAGTALLYLAVTVPLARMPVASRTT